MNLGMMKMNNVYLVRDEYCNENSGCFDDIRIYVCGTYEKAIKIFGEIRKNIDEFVEDGTFDKIEENKNSYCAYEDGNYTYNHYSVSIEKKEVLV